MKCPDCKTDMESEDASIDSECHKNPFFKGRIISAVYFCPGCGEYFQWCKGDGLFRQNAGIAQRSTTI